MKKNILYIIFFMVLVACKREAVFELEGYSGQILRDRTVGLRYPTAPGRQYFLSTQADSGDYFFLTGEITPGKVTFLDFGYQHLPLYVEKQHYRVVKRMIIIISSPIRKNPCKIGMCNICVGFIPWIRPIINYAGGMTRFPILVGKQSFPIV